MPAASGSGPEGPTVVLSHGWTDNKIRDARVRDATVVGLERPGGDIQVHAVLILHDAADADDVVRQANTHLGGHQQIRGFTVWPDDDFPRTASTKVRKADVVAWIESTSAVAPPPSATDATPAGSALERLVAQLEGVPAEAIRPDARLSSDLNIDSLGRVELLSLVEEELGVYIDDGDLEPDGTLAQLQAKIDAGASAGGAPQEGIFGWPLNPVVAAVRIGLQQVIIQPLLTLFYRRRVKGIEHLRGVRGPVVFAANHHLHNDNALIICAIPLRWRWKLSVAAAADDIFGQRVRGFIAAFMGNAFPMAREGAVRRSLDLLGARLDRGFNVLIYPEGKLTVDGPLQEFKSGTGLVAIHGAIPVIPMRLKVHRHSRIDIDTPGTELRGDVEVVFGPPLSFPIDADPTRATDEIRAAVEAL